MNIHEKIVGFTRYYLWGEPGTNNIDFLRSESLRRFCNNYGNLCCKSMYMFYSEFVKHYLTKNS